MSILDKFLGHFGFSWSGDYTEYSKNSSCLKRKNPRKICSNPRGIPDIKTEYSNVNHEKYPNKIAILMNSRCIVEQLTVKERSEKSKAIEELMLYFVKLPYQIGNCSYIGEGKAWTLYNWDNKRTLSLAINELNYYLSIINELEEGESAIPKVLPVRFHINFNNICFDWGTTLAKDSLPRSYILYTPITKKNRHSQYPLIAFFNTIQCAPDDNNGENYCGELYYSINGELAKASIHCWKNGYFAEFNFSVVGRTFQISSIRTLGKDHKLFTLYDCTWKYTDYIDFSD